MPSDYQAPEHSIHEKTIRWHDAAQVAPLLRARSGLEVMRGIKDGLLPPPPMVQMIGLRCVAADSGEVVTELEHDGTIENAIGTLHGGAIVTTLDTAMACAAYTTLEAGSVVVTLDISTTFLRPIKSEDCPISATGRVLSNSRRMIYATGEVRSLDGTLVAHAVGNFSVTKFA